MGIHKSTKVPAKGFVIYITVSGYIYCDPDQVPGWRINMKPSRPGVNGLVAAGLSAGTKNLDECEWVHVGFWRAA
jgi:hypothetical protein